MGRVYQGWAPEGKVPVRFWVLSVLCSILPDFDVVGFAFGIDYDDLWGHRGMTHGLPFAFGVGVMVVLLAFSEVPRLSKAWWGLVFYFFVVTASHGLFDAFTDGGLGVAFFAPFDATRYFFPWQPIRVSPIGASFFSGRGWETLRSELLWLWLPSVVVFAGSILVRSKKKG